jgi:ribose/xylose/arabinose/galactoside ABC-type transport system permease subunit
MTPAARRLLSRFGPALALLLLMLAIGARQPTFLGWPSIQTIAMQATLVALPAVGMTFVVVAGGIDISIGAVVALCAVAAAGLVRAGQPPLVAALLAVALGGICGLGNGLLVTRLRIAPFLVTLGTMGIARGFAKWLAEDQKIDADPGFLADVVHAAARPAWLLFGPAVWLLLVVAGAGALLLRRTVFGLHVVAVGSNAANARLCGVRVERTLLQVYALCGLCAGAVGVLQFGELGCGLPTASIGLELQVVAAVVIGGASLSGGEGSMAGAVTGALLTVVLAAGCTQLGIRNHWQDVLIGAVIVAAVAIDRWRKRG